jgi:hypothetical protein
VNHVGLTRTIAKWVAAVAVAQLPALAQAASPRPGTDKASSALSFNPFTKAASANAAGGPLFFAAGSSAVAAPALVTLADSPAGPAPGTSIFISDAALLEPTSGTASLVFTLTLSQASPVPVKVNYSTSGNTATAGADFVTRSGTVTFPAGSRNATISITVNADSKVEATETFFVNLSNPSPSPVTIGNVNKRATGTIFDSDRGPSRPKLTLAVGAGGSRIVEGDSGFRTANLKVMLSDTPTSEVRYTFKTADGTATVQDNEYVPVNKTGIYAKNTKNLIQAQTVKIVGDLKKGGDEYFFALITNPVNADIDNGSVRITIVQDDF